MAYADRVATSTRFTTIAGVAAIHGLIGYALLTGMAANFVREIVPTLTIRNIPLDPPPPPEPTPPMERRATQPTTITTVVPIAPLRPAETALPTLPLTPLPTFPSLPTGPVDVVPEGPPPLVSKAAGVRASGSRGAWITTDDYPPSAIRAGEEGVVGISLNVGADGRAQSCTVTVPSGHAALDQATCRLYQRRARFTPARDDMGTTIPSVFNDRVRWELPR